MRGQGDQFLRLTFLTRSVTARPCHRRVVRPRFRHASVASPTEQTAASATTATAATATATAAAAAAAACSRAHPHRTRPREQAEDQVVGVLLEATPAGLTSGRRRPSTGARVEVWIWGEMNIR